MVEYFDKTLKSEVGVAEYIRILISDIRRVGFCVMIEKTFHELNLSMVYRVKGHYHYKKKEVNSEKKIQKKV